MGLQEVKYLGHSLSQPESVSLNSKVQDSAIQNCFSPLFFSLF